MKWNLPTHTIAQNLKESQDVDISSQQNIQMNDVWQHQGTWNKKSNTISKQHPAQQGFLGFFYMITLK